MKKAFLSAAAVVAALVLPGAALAQSAGEGSIPSTPPWQAASPWPDRIVVTVEEDPATSFSVTWRTSADVRETRAEIVRADDLMPHFDDRIRDGCLYGDFQFAIDPSTDDFLRTGVCACYEPVAADEPLTADGRRARRPVPPGVVAAAGDAEHLAHQLDRGSAPAVADEGEPHGSSLAKKAVAFFEISRSMRRRWFSARSRSTSRRRSASPSAGVSTAGDGGASLATQSRIERGSTPRPWAAWATV